MASLNMKRAVISLLTGTKATTGYYGLSDVYDNTDDLADNIFWQFSTTERSAILALWSANSVQVKGEYVRSNYTTPRIIVLRSSDSERLDHAGDYLGLDDDASDADNLHEHHQYGSDFDESVQLIVQAAGHGPGQRDDLYMVLRELIIRARPYFENLGASNLLWRNGRDGEGFRPDKSPHIVHEATATLSYFNRMTWSEKATRITRIRSNYTGYNQGRVTVDPFEDS